VISESWLKPSLPNSLVHLHNYNLYRSDREGRGAGGVAIFFRQDIKVKIIGKSPSLYSASAEYLILELTINQKTLLLVSVYRPPDTKFDSFEEIISQILPQYKDIIITGRYEL